MPLADWIPVDLVCEPLTAVAEVLEPSDGAVKVGGLCDINIPVTIKVSCRDGENEIRVVEDDNAILTSIQTCS